jgi:hypothetical protein
MLNTVSVKVSKSPGYLSLKVLFLFPILIVLFSAYFQTALAQLPFETGPSNSRFFGYANKNPRELVLSVVKNISENVEPGELLLNFRAEDRNNPKYNLS